MKQSVGTTPSHYSMKNGKEPADYILEYDLDYFLGNTFKYLVRNGKKSTSDMDLYKAYDYLKYHVLKGKAPYKMDIKSEVYRALKANVLYENVFEVKDFKHRVVILDLLSGYPKAALALLKDEVDRSH